MKDGIVIAEENKPINLRLNIKQYHQFIEIFNLLKEHEHIAGSSRNKCVTFLILKAIPIVKKELEKRK